MSFGGAGGFNFTLPTTTTSSGFSFSNAAPKPTNAPTGGGFPFGTTSGFNFGSPSTSVAASSSFGTPTAVASTAGSSFGTSSASSALGSGFGITSASTATGNSFGMSSAPATASSFGMPSASTVAGSTFGIATAPSTSGSNFGMPSASAAGGSLSFNLGSGPTAVSSSSAGISSFTLNSSLPQSTPAASQSTGSFNFALPSSTGGLNLINPVASSIPSLSSNSLITASTSNNMTFPNSNSSVNTGGFNSFSSATPGLNTTNATTNQEINASSGMTTGIFKIPPVSSLQSTSSSANPLTAVFTAGLTSTTAPQIAIPPMSTGPGFKLATSSSLLSTPSQNANASISTTSVVNPLQVQPSATTSASFGGFQLPTSSAATPNLGLFSSGTSAFSVTGTTSTSATGTATLSTATITSSLGGTGSGGGPNLSMRQLEEKLNKWLVELKEQEERFIRQAAHVNAWDQILQNGHDQVQSLKDTLHTVKSDQSRLEAELDFIRGQQEELERLLDPLEAAVSSTPATQLHQGDRQRDNMYHLALNLDGQLRQMTDDLGKVIEHLNSGSGSSQPNDPVNLVARILSAHMDSLKWVDQNTALLSQKMEDLSRVTSDSGRRV